MSLQVFAQKYIARNGHIWFYSQAPMENIEAHNYQATSILDSKTGEMAFSLMIVGFQFEKALMQEHFNEKYLHSEKFPKASFKGKILNLDEIDLSENGKYDVKINGDINIHGVTKNIQAEGTLEVQNGKILAKSKFPISVEEFNIEIPDLVKDNIAKVVDVTVDMEYEAYK